MVMLLESVLIQIMIDVLNCKWILTIVVINCEIVMNLCKTEDSLQNVHAKMLVIMMMIRFVLTRTTVL